MTAFTRERVSVDRGLQREPEDRVLDGAIFRDAGLTPAERTTGDEIVEEHDGPVPPAQRRAEPQPMRART